MQDPFIVKKNLSEQEIKNFHERFGVYEGFDCSVRENIWRRHQVEDNKIQSGWRNKTDVRRSLIHFRDKYGLVGNDFCLTQRYLFVNAQLPKEEADQLQLKLERIDGAKVEIYESHPECIQDYCKGYVNIDLVLTNTTVSEEIKMKPWVVFKTGIRTKPIKGHPTFIKKNQLKDFFPAYIELGCGPSIEAGIPALNYFHKLFSISHDNKFVFGVKNNTLIDSLKNLDDFYSKSTYMQSCCLSAMPTNFYFNLKQLVDSGDILTPIMNNNFDGLSKSVGLTELCLRQFDKTGVYPDYDFSKQAKSLIVVGSHADRRMCQKAARKNGLKIVYVDPEKYDIGNTIVDYPLEGPQDEDFVLKVSASELF